VLERVVIDPAVRAALAGHTRSSPGKETGGILLGHLVDAATLRITRASPPGPRAIHLRLAFSRDTRFLQRYLDDVYDRTAGHEDYVGEWHVHPALDAPPSYVDRRSLWRIARRRNYATDNPVLLIIESAPPERRLRVYGFAVRPRKRWDELTLAAERSGRHTLKP
jgi:integrative and conjugative element protein (TIGR02256 family)